MVRNLLGMLVKRLRKVFSMSEAATKQVDEVGLEHLLLYHGLVGSTPDNQRSFRDVRDDINRAVVNSSPLQMSVALQLPPLWWEDKLRTIFDEIVAKDGAERAINALLPEMSDVSWPNRNDPLGHPEWHVRANAALMLSHLKARQGQDRMARSLHDAAINARPAFCHIAYALGRLGCDQSRAELSQHLDDEEAWFRVDACGALAHWPSATVGDTLMGAMLSINQLSDYAAVAIARRHHPAEFLAGRHAVEQQGACAMVLYILSAARQTFGSEAVAETQLVDCLSPLCELAQSEPTPLSLRATLQLIDWCIENAKLPSGWERIDLLQTSRDKLTAGGGVEKVVLRYLQGDRQTKPEALAQQRAAIELAGDIQLAATVPSLIQILQPDQPLLDVAVEALAKIGSSEAVAPLVLVADKLVKISDRTALPLSKQPVNENDPTASKSYWQILKALGSGATTESIRYLLSATSDYAPDKREVALSSLIRLCESESAATVLPEFTPRIRAAISTALDDPSASVRAVALSGVVALTDGDSIADVIRLTDSPEISVSRQAYMTLEHLWVQGFGASISTAGQERLKANSNTHWARQFSEFLAGKVS